MTAKKKRNRTKETIEKIILDCKVVELKYDDRHRPRVRIYDGE